MDLGLAGAKAIVTGGSRGIGRAVAQTLGGEGVAVAICARGREGLDRAVTELRSHGVDVRGQVLDVSDETAIPGFVDWAAAEFGGLDINVSNVSNVSAGASAAPGQWAASFASDLLAFVRLVEAATPRPPRRPRGRRPRRWRQRPPVAAGPM